MFEIIFGLILLALILIGLWIADWIAFRRMKATVVVVFKVSHGFKKGDVVTITDGSDKNFLLKVVGAPSDTTLLLAQCRRDREV